MMAASQDMTGESSSVVGLDHRAGLVGNATARGGWVKLGE